MTLLEDIQNSAVSPDSDLGTVLRKCKVLAARLDNEPLENWIRWESEGYPEGVELPSYRVWPMVLKGKFTGRFGTGDTNIPIPSIAIPERFREEFSRYECRESVTSIGASLKMDHTGLFQVPMGDLHVALGMNVYQNQNCNLAWGEFSARNLVEILNTVRNKILDFALALWKKDPKVGELGEKADDELQPQMINQIFNMTIHGGSFGLIGNANSSSIEVNVRQYDFESLSDVLRKNGVSSEDIEELRRVLESDDKPSQPGRFGAGVSAWIEKMVGKAASGTWDIAAGTAGGFLSQVLTKYFGLG